MDEVPREPGSVAGPALFAVAAAVCVFFANGLISRPVDDLVGFVSDDPRDRHWAESRAIEFVRIALSDG